MDKKLKRGYKCKEIGEKELAKPTPDYQKALRFLTSAYKLLSSDTHASLTTLIERCRKELSETDDSADDEYPWLVRPKEDHIKALNYQSEYSKYTSLADFGYYFDNNYRLLSIKDNSVFRYINQDHYDWLSVHVNEFVQNVLRTEYNLKEQWLPSASKIFNNVHEKISSGLVNVFYTGDIMGSDKPLLLIIQGLGNVRAGVWSNNVCINKNLWDGSMFRYLEKSKELGWEVLIVNPNRNMSRKCDKFVRGSETQFDHMCYVYDNILSKVKTDKIVCVAHSFGGCVAIEVLFGKKKRILSKLKAIAFTDSVHVETEIFHSADIMGKEFLSTKFKARNWKRSMMELDKPLGVIDGVFCHSAGTNEHIMTSTVAKNSVFRFLYMALVRDDDLNPADVLKLVESMKIKGNELIKKKEISEALSYYCLADDLLSYIDEGNMMQKEGFDMKKFEELSLSVNGNISVSYLNLKQFQKSIFYSSLVIGEDKLNLKCLRRRAYAFIRINENERALKDINTILNDINNEDKTALSLLKSIKK